LRYWWRKNPQVQQAASTLIELKLLVWRTKGEEFLPQKCIAFGVFFVCGPQIET
jgi:hypothetical protein